MKKLLPLCLLLLAGCVAVVSDGRVPDFWDYHGVGFIICLIFFPRITMLVVGTCGHTYAYPVLFWLGWIFAPRFVIAILATTIYWDTNPVLCILAWMCAFGTGHAETNVANNYRKNRNRP